MNSTAGGVGIELIVKDENGSESNDFISFRVEECPKDNNDDDDDDDDDRRELQSNIIKLNTECGVISETLNLQGQLAPKGIRIMGFFDQCQLDKGSLLLNIPNDGDLKLIVGSFDFQNLHRTNNNNDAVSVDLTKIQQLPTAQGLYKISLQDPLIGKDLVTNQPKNLSNINTIALWNEDSKDAIDFSSSSTIGMSISFEKQ